MDDRDATTSGQVGVVQTALSTHRFEGYLDHVSDISLQERDLIKIFVENVFALPSTRTVLEHRYPGAAAEIGAVTDDILRLFKRLNDKANEWLADRIPAIKDFAEDIVRYGSQVQRIYQNLRDLIHDLAEMPAGMDGIPQGHILNDIGSNVSLLCQQAQRHAAHATFANKSSERLVVGIRRTCRELEDLHRSVRAARSKKSNELEQINRKIKAMLNRIHELNREVGVHRKNASKNAKLAMIPFAGIGFGVAALVEQDKAQKLAKEAEALTRQYQDAKKKDAKNTAAYAALAMLEATDGWLAAIEKDLGQILPILGRLRGIWDAVASDLLIVPATLRRITMDPDPRPILMEMSLDVAVDEWAALSEKAKALSKEIFPAGHAH